MLVLVPIASTVTAESPGCSFRFGVFFEANPFIYCRNIAWVGVDGAVDGDGPGAYDYRQGDVNETIDSYDIYEGLGGGAWDEGAEVVCILGPPEEVADEMSFVWVDAAEVPRGPAQSLDFFIYDFDSSQYAGYGDAYVESIDANYPDWVHYCAFVPGPGQVSLIGSQPAANYFDEYGG